MYQTIFSRSLLQRTKCTHEEKLRLLPLIKQLSEYTQMTRKEGLECLQAIVDAPEGRHPHFLKNAISIILSEISTHKFKEQLINPLYQSSVSGIELLKKLIIIKGMECILDKNGPRFTLFRLCVLLESPDNDVSLYDWVELVNNTTYDMYSKHKT